MDEIKDVLTSEQEVENNVDSDTDTITEDQADLNEATELVDFESNEDEAVESDENEIVESKKKGLLQTPIIISLILVIIVALGFGVFKCFFDTSVVGSWIVMKDDENQSTEDEAKSEEEKVNERVYYIFNSDGTVSIKGGTIEQRGTYTVTTESAQDDSYSSTPDQTEAKQIITINIPNVLQGSYYYKVTGNWITGRKLNLSQPLYDGLDVDMKNVTYKEFKLTPDKNFKPSDKITDKWVDSYGYGVSYDLKPDGTAVLNEMDTLIVRGTYTYTDDTITITYYNPAEGKMDISYTYENDVMTINGIPYIRESNATFDEAKTSDDSNAILG